LLLCNQVKGTEYFSVPAFFVCFREAVEACVIIAVLIKFLDKVNKKHLQRDVWLGALAGLAIAIIAGIGLIIAFYAVDKNFFVGRQEMLFEGILSLFASIIITVLATSMLKISKFQAMWEAKLSANLVKAEAEGSSLRRSTMFWIPFVSVLREGLETVIFLAGVGAGYPAKSIPIPGIVGLLTGLACGYALFRAGSKTSVHTFLLCSTVLLTFIAAGLMARASHEFQEAGVFGTYENADGEVVGRMNKPAW
jgi:FTR1 family protein